MQREIMQQKTPPTKRLLTVKEVAEQLGVGVNTIYRAIEAKRVRVARLTSDIIRIDPKDLDTWIEECKE